MNPAVADEVLVGDIIHRARQHWFRVAILGLVGLSLGLTITIFQPTEFRASTVVFAPGEFRFIPVTVEADDEARPRVITQDTEAAFIRSSSVLAAVNARRDGAEPITADRINISVPTGTRALFIAYTADDPDDARRAAQLVSEEYVRSRNEFFEQRRNRQVDILIERRDELRAELAAFLDLIAELGWQSLRRPSLSDRHVELTTLIETIETETAEVVESAASPAAIVRAATRPRRPERSNAEVPPFSGLAVGALLGLAWGVRADRRRDVINNLRDIRAVSELPVLARLGIRAGSDSDSAELSRLATEVRLRAPDAVLITDTGAHAPITSTLGEQLRTALTYAPESVSDTDPPEPVVMAQTVGIDEAPMLRAARRADLTLVVVRLGRTRRGDLATVDRLLARAGTTPQLILAGTRAINADGTSHD